MNARVPPHALQPALALERVSQAWDNDIVRQLTDYIAIPAKSPMFSPDWAEQGLLDTVVRNAAAWVESQKVEGLKLEVVRLEGRTPVLFFEIDATQAGATDTVLIQFFIIHDDGLGRELKHLLLRKAAAGVNIYVLFDSVGSHALPFLQRMVPRLRDEGWRIAPVALVEQGRVAVADEVGELLGARLVKEDVDFKVNRENLSNGAALWVDVVWSKERPRGLGARRFVALMDGACAPGAQA